MSISFNSHKEGINLIVASASLIAAIASLIVGCNQLHLQKVDTSQQTQINQLTDILKEIKLENKESKNQTVKLIMLTEAAKQQTQELIDITQSSQKQNSLTNQLLVNLERQVNTTNKQLIIALKTDSLNSFQSSLKDQSDFFALRSIYDRINNFYTIGAITNLEKRGYKERIQVLRVLKNDLESGLINPFVLKHQNISKKWKDFYEYIRFYSPFFAFVDSSASNGVGSEASIFKDSDSFTDTCISIKNQYFNFINLVGNDIQAIQNRTYIPIPEEYLDDYDPKKKRKSTIH